MTALSALGAVTLAFLMLFWLSPIGVPTLKRLGEGKPSPDLTFGYGPDDTYRLLEVYGQRGITHWRRLLLLDMIFPGVYGALLALLASRWAMWVDAGPAWRTVAITCPIISATADYFENILLLCVIASFPKKIPFAVTAASAFTRIKFTFFVAALVIPSAHWGLTQLTWMIYGAYGFTGRLILEEAIRRGHRPILAGRDRRQIEDLAKRHGLQSHVLSVDDPAALRTAARACDVVVNAAGPIAETGPKLITACLDAGTAYMDVSGEFHHLQFVEALDARAKQAGIALLTGAGFGVTYGDCLARYALDRLPDATRLRLSVAAANAQTTPGARRTIVDVLAKGGYAVEGGRFRPRPLAHQTWIIRSASSEVAFAAAPLGELAALRRSTGIADIVVGRPMPAGQARALRLLSPLLQCALAVPAIRRFASRDRGSALDPAPTPPDGWRSRIWAEARNDRGDAVLAQLETGEGYAATAEAALANIEALFAHRPEGPSPPVSCSGQRISLRCHGWG